MGRYYDFNPTVPTESNRVPREGAEVVLHGAFCFNAQVKRKHYGTRRGHKLQTPMKDSIFLRIIIYFLKPVSHLRLWLEVLLHHGGQIFISRTYLASCIDTEN